MTSEFFHRYKAGLLLIIYSVLTIVCLANRVDPYVIGFRSVAWFLISPQIVYSGQFFNKLDSLQGRLFQLAMAEGENVILREQNIQLVKKELERDALEIENNRLRETLNLQQRFFPTGIVAEIVGRDIRDWFYSIVINKGEADGIPMTAAVLGKVLKKPALVGRIIELNRHTSKILMITDPLSAVSVSIPTTGDLGLLRGQNQPYVVVKYLSLRSQVQVGDAVVSAGLGGVFPPGVPVGHVVRVMNTEDGFFKEAFVEPDIDFGALQEVLILERGTNMAEMVER